MRQRICDNCKSEIPSGNEFMKVCRTHWDGHQQKLTHVGDLCPACWEALMK